MDTANQCLMRGGAPIEMAPKPFAVLRYLVEHPGRLITHDELLDALWPDTYVQPQVLRTYMLELRKVLGDDAGQPRFIQTLPKRGYRFVATVTEGNGVHPYDSAGTVRPGSRRKEIVGRDGELELLNSYLRQLETGQRRVVFVFGEAGIGKTALVDAFCRQIDPLIEASVTRGQCVQGLGGIEEYYPVTEALNKLCAGQDGQRAYRILARRAPAWLAQGREETASLTEERRGSKDRTLGDLCEALEEIAAQSPLVLVFEDLHWADDSTLNLISALARRRAQTRLMVLATLCPLSGDLEDKLKRLKQDLLLRRLCVEMKLGPLRKAAVAELIGRELDEPEPPAGLADFVYLRSEGNPLFVTAVVEHLIGQGFLVRNGAGQWEQRAAFEEMEAGVPDQLARMIEMEIGSLSEHEQHMLEAASLMRVAFPAWAVAAALKIDPVETEEACDALARRLHFVLRRAG
jgi:predicted ATPase